MAKRQGNRLAALQIAKLVKRPGLHNDGHGLYLETRDGRCCWRFRYKFNGVPKWLGLGPVHSVSLAEARARAHDARQLILDGKDPLSVKAAAKAAAQIEAARTLTFEQALRQFIETDKVQKLKDQASWVRSIDYLSAIGNLPLQQIDSAVVLACLKPIFAEKAETGTRLRSRIERVFHWAAAHKYFSGTNPASRDVLKDALPAKPKVKHHPALAYAELPAFMAQLRDRDSVSATALQFLILTAARTSDVTGALWSEIDMKAKTWTVPDDRMKAGKTHVVPLSDAAMAILRAMPRTGDFVFINGGGLPLSQQAMSELLKGMKQRSTTPGKLAVPHGFRSTFMDWAHEQTSYAKHVIDMALAHTIGDKVEAAYRRGDLLAKRAQLMAAWSKFCTSGDGATVADGDNVVPIRA